MLGIDDPSKARPEPYRDHFCANAGDPELVELERLGMVEPFRSFMGDTYTTYRTTEAGRAAAIASFKTIQHPKKRRTYLAFLRASDFYPDLTFREFLVSPDWADARRNA